MRALGKEVIVMRKPLILVLCILLVTLTACTGGPGNSSGGDASEGANVTGSGNEYLAYVEDDNTAHIEYLGDELDINEWEWEDEDEDEDTAWFCLKMTFTNDFDSDPGEDYDDDFLLNSLDGSFAIQAIQDDKVILPRGESEIETIEEKNVYRRIEQGRDVECEYWFPVDSEKDVTIQVLNIDGEDTVMAEITYPAGQEYF